MMFTPTHGSHRCMPGCEQVDDTDVINFLLSTEIIPLCLRTMEIGSELSKTVATFIVQKVGGMRAHVHVHTHVFKMYMYLKRTCI